MSGVCNVYTRELAFKLPSNDVENMSMIVKDDRVQIMHSQNVEGKKTSTKIVTFKPRLNFSLLKRPISSEIFEGLSQDRSVMIQKIMVNAICTPKDVEDFCSQSTRNIEELRGKEEAIDKDQRLTQEDYEIINSLREEILSRTILRDHFFARWTAKKSSTTDTSCLYDPDFRKSMILDYEQTPEKPRARTVRYSSSDEASEVHSSKSSEDIDFLTMDMTEFDDVLGDDDQAEFLDSVAKLENIEDITDLAISGISFEDIGVEAGEMEKMISLASSYSKSYQTQSELKNIKDDNSSFWQGSQWSDHFLEVPKKYQNHFSAKGLQDLWDKIIFSNSRIDKEQITSQLELIMIKKSKSISLKVASNFFMALSRILCLDLQKHEAFWDSDSDDSEEELTDDEDDSWRDRIIQSDQKAKSSSVWADDETEDEFFEADKYYGL